MAGRGLTEQIFFVYDHTTLQKEEDDLKDAIVYFFPPAVKDDDQCALCGQLMGMVSFFQSTWSAKPHLYKLARHKFVLKHVENRYTLALGRDQLVSDSCLEEQLRLLYNTFTLYKGSLGGIRENCVSNGLSFTETLKHIWECFLPFCCAYGDTVRHGFVSLPTIELPKSGSDVFLQASAMLQASKRRPGVLGGAVLSSNSVLCTQLSEELTSRFLVIKPQQTHLPCEPVLTEFPLPVGVRIINVFVNLEEYRKLFHQSIGASCKHTKVSNFRPNQRNVTDNPPPYSFVRNNMNISQNATVQDFDKFAHSSGSSVHLDTLTNVGCQGDGSSDTRSPSLLTEYSKQTSGLKLSETVGMGFKDSATNQNQDLSSSDEDNFKGPNSSIKSENSSTKLHFSADVHIDGEKSLVPGDNHPEDKSSPYLNTVKSDKVPVVDREVTDLMDNKSHDMSTEAVLSSAQSTVTNLEIEHQGRDISNAANSPHIGHSEETDLGSQITEDMNKTKLVSGTHEKLTDLDNNVDKTYTNLDNKNSEKENTKTVSNDSGSNGLDSTDVTTKISETDHSDLSEQNIKTRIPDKVLDCKKNGENVSDEVHVDNTNGANFTVNEPTVDSIGGEQTSIVIGPGQEQSSQVDNCFDVSKMPNAHHQKGIDARTPPDVLGNDSVQTVLDALDTAHNTSELLHVTDSSDVKNSSEILVSDGVQNSSDALEKTPQLANNSSLVQHPSKIVTDNPYTVTTIESSITGEEVQFEHSETRDSCSEIKTTISDEVINPYLESQKVTADNYETVIEKQTTETNTKLSDYEINSVSKNSDNIASTLLEKESYQNNTVSQNSYWSYHGNNSADSAISVSEDRLVSGSFEEECNNESLSTKGIENLSDTFTRQNEGKETFVFSEMERQESKMSSSSETQVFQNSATTTGLDNYSSAFVSKPLTYNAQISSNNAGKDSQNNPHGDDMKSLTLYIQGHSDSMLILLMEEGSRYDKDCIQALWKLALPQLGDLDFHVKELIEIESPRPAHEDYYFLRFNEFQRQVSGNVTKPVASGEYEFCDLAIDLHEEFRKTPSLTELSVRTHLANVYAHRSVNHEIYFQSVNKYRQANGLPFTKDAVFSLDQIAQRKLHKHHNITFV